MKKRILISAVAIFSIAMSIFPATAADNPGLIPKKAWNSGQSVVKVGLIGPMTGIFAVLGLSQTNSIQVVADQINASGGIGGAKIELVVRDDALNPVTAANHAKEYVLNLQPSFVPNEHCVWEFKPAGGGPGDTAESD